LISLYFHIPFCTKKCDYCHFYVLPDREADKKLLMEGFKLEWERWLPVLQTKQVATVYFGGGTPSLLGPDYISEILDWIQFPPSTEITLEANPENVTLELMQSYSKAGINRVSIGVQTLDNPLLHTIGRTHSSQKAIDAVHLTSAAGIRNITIDLMYDLPGQNLKSWENTLKQATALPITHLSLYNLTVEPHTVFFKKRQEITSQMPDEQTSLQMYEMAKDVFESHDLRQYEISAFAKEGYPSKHNMGYWTGRPFLGFGPSAFSYLVGKRFKNIAHLNKYTRLLRAGESPIDFEEKLDTAAAQRELLAIHLRLVDGVNITHFESIHGLVDVETQAAIHQLIQEKYLEKSGNRLKLTHRGILFYDTVASEIV
jgi:oxygen-independent coproporphyrinogen-3 oxidase